MRPHVDGDGDGQANRALHRIAVCRLRCDPRTRPTPEGLSTVGRVRPARWALALTDAVPGLRWAWHNDVGLFRLVPG
jgi:hypothetical protein